VPRWPVVVRDDRLGTGQWQWVVGSSRRERGISGEDVKWMQFSPWKGLVESPGWYQCDREVTTGLAEGYVVLRRTCTNYSLGGGFLRAFKGVDEWCP
jgi:hypothetical protein